MVAREYKEKEGRDPNIYLGIDESIIPFEYFEGIYTDESLVFTDDFFGINFRVIPDTGVIFDKYNINMSMDSYVLAEDLKDKKWMLIGSYFVSENSNFFTKSSETLLTIKGHDVVDKRITERYKSGETGLLEESEKVYNEKGDWMQAFASFDTMREEKLIDRIRDHATFVFRRDNWLPIEMREMILLAPKHIIKQIKEEILYPQITAIFHNEDDLKLNKGDEIRIDNMYMIGVGKIFLREDNNVEDIIIEKIIEVTVEPDYPYDKRI